MYPSPYVHDNYAGALEDTIVHSLLVEVLLDAAKSETPLTFIDTHAGAGVYRLERATSRRQHILRNSSLALYRCRRPSLQTELARLWRKENVGANRMVRYLGSSALAWAVLPRSTKMIVNERNPVICRRLRSWARCKPNVAVEQGDGFALARSMLRSVGQSRKYILHIDPAYEAVPGGESDYERILELLCVSKPIPLNAMLAVTYPAAGEADVRRITSLEANLRRYGLRMVDSQFMYDSRRAGLVGAGLLLINPPATYERNARSCLRRLAAILRLKGPRARVRLM